MRYCLRTRAYVVRRTKEGLSKPTLGGASPTDSANYDQDYNRFARE